MLVVAACYDGAPGAHESRLRLPSAPRASPARRRSSRRHRPREERSGNWLSLKPAQALLNAPDISTTQGLQDRAIIAVLLGCALRRSEVAALTEADRRCSGGLTPEATGAARRANTAELFGVVTGTQRLRSPTVLWCPCGFSAGRAPVGHGARLKTPAPRDRALRWPTMTERFRGWRVWVGAGQGAESSAGGCLRGTPLLRAHDARSNPASCTPRWRRPATAASGA